jgi:transposase-like protein
LPEHLAADEKHTRIKGENAYGVFKDEAQCLDQDYSPKSVNTDGWKATIKAWKNLFPSIAILCCFLHLFLKMRDRCSKKYKDLFPQVAHKFWNCYKATSKRSFSQQVRRLYEWSLKTAIPDAMLHPIKKLRENLYDYAKAYDLPGAHRTSNMVDRLMKRMDRHLFSTCYFHGSTSSDELNIRGWALI